MKRAAIVLAGTAGLGRACAEELARAGTAVAVCSRRQDEVAATVNALRDLGTDSVGVAADVSRLPDVERVFATSDRHFGRLDVLVTNAGGPPAGTLERLDDHQWAIAFELTFMSAVRAIRCAIPRMRAGGFGRIVVLGSSSARQPIDNLVLSNAFRPALVGVVKTLASELASDGITVNMVSPGRIDTARVRDLDEARARVEQKPYEAVRNASEKRIPAGRYGRPEEVGSLVAFLASEDAGYITGQSILVDGGMVRSLP